MYALLGAERLGVLSLAWVAIGAFALLDAGLGRALTHETSRLLALGRASEIRPVVHGTLLLLGAIGIASALGIMIGVDAIVARLHAAGGLAPEIRATLLVCAVAVPLMTVSAGIRGVLEAHGRFDMTSLARVGLGAATYLGPWLAVRASNSLVLAVGSIVAARFVATILLYLVMESTLEATPPGPHGPVWARVRQTMTGGLWMTVASVAGALLTLVDRFILGAMVSLAAIAYYSTPHELIGKLTLIPMALSAVLFPAMSSSAARESADVVRLFTRGMRYTFVLLLPVVAIGAGLAREWLALWLGGEFSQSSQHVVQWLCLSVLLQGLAVTPLNMLQAAGRAQVTAWLQLVQLPLFMAGVWLAVSVAGINGAAFVWAVRMLADLTLLLGVSGRTLPALASAVRSWMFAIGATVVWFIVMIQLDSLPARLAALTAGLLTFGVCLPRLIGSDDLRQLRALASHRFGGQPRA